LLAPMEQLTRDLSTYDACISAILPGILGLKLTLEVDTQDGGVKMMKTGFLKALSHRFDPLLTNNHATVATAVDPRFKMRFFMSDVVRNQVKVAVRDAAQEAVCYQIDDDAAANYNVQPQPEPDINSGQATASSGTGSPTVSTSTQEGTN